MRIIEFALKHYILLIVLAFFGFITINHSWHKPVEKGIVVVPQVEEVFAPVPRVEKKVVVSRAMTVAERAQYQDGVENVDDWYADFDMSFCIKIGTLHTVFFEDKEIVYRFIQMCHKNPDVAEGIGRELRGVKIIFIRDFEFIRRYSNHDKVVINSGFIFFSCVERLVSPENVLAYLKSPYRK